MSDFSQIQKDFIQDLFTKLNTTLNIKSEEIREELKTQVSQIKEEVRATVGQLQNQIQELEKKNKKLEQNLIYLDRKSRKNNIVIFGIEKNEQDVIEWALNIFKNILELNVEVADINDAYRIKPKNQKSDPIVVEFISFQKKLLVLKNFYKLKGQNIYIARAQCKKDREDSKILINQQKKARAKGQTAFIKGGKLYVAGEEYTVKQLENQIAQRVEINSDFEEEEQVLTKEITTGGIKQQSSDIERNKKEEQDEKRAKSGVTKEKKITDSTSERVQTRSAITYKKN